MATNRNGGFRIYGDMANGTKSHEYSMPSTTLQDNDIQVAMLQKLHAHTKLFALLEYKQDIKGIRYYDYTKNNFIDIAPWQINMFNISGMKLAGVRVLELVKVDSGNKHTHVVEFITQHEIKKYYRPNRMTPNDLAKALSYIMEYIEDSEYENIMSKFRSV